MKASIPLALLCASLSTAARADNEFSVGTGPGCTHATIQSALDAAANDGLVPSLIKITRSLSYTQQALRINDREYVELRGGYARCTDTLPDANRTRIDGSGGAKQTVIAVVGNFPSTVRLAGLEIVGGDAEDHEYGGAVYARHGGLLVIAASSIHNNRAGYGGGIAIEGRGTELALRDDVLVYSNSAMYEGGGAWCRDGSIYANARGTGFFNNNALNEGGGLRLRHCDAELASNGPLNAGILYGNTSYNGAGLSATDSVIKVYSVLSNAPNRIAYNRASSNGGGFALRNGSSITLWDTLIEGNTASTGGAGWAYSDTNRDPRIRLRSARNRDAETPITAVACASGVNCNRVTGNLTRVTGSSPGDGAAFYFDWSSPTGCNFPFSCSWPETFVADADIQDAQIDRNSGDSLIYYRQHYDHYRIAQSLFFGNSVSDALIKTGDDDKVWIAQTTITGNNIGSAVVRAPQLDLRCAIVNQAGVIRQGSGALNAQFVLVPSTSQLPSNTSVFQGAPRFVSTANDNYRLFPGQGRLDPVPSPGIDIANGCGVFQRGNDLDGLIRPADISAAPNQFGTLDLGPYEARITLPGF
jgi:hypothetical protein